MVFLKHKHLQYMRLKFKLSTWFTLKWVKGHTFMVFTQIDEYLTTLQLN